MLTEWEYNLLRSVNEGAIDMVAADELKMFIDNDGQLYRSQMEPIQKNLLRKKAKGNYDSKLAVKLWMYLVDNGAKKYHKDFRMSGKWNDVFPKSLRLEVAKMLAADFEENYDDGYFSESINERYVDVNKEINDHPVLQGLVSKKHSFSKKELTDFFNYFEDSVSQEMWEFGKITVGDGRVFYHRGSHDEEQGMSIKIDARGVKIRRMYNKDVFFPWKKDIFDKVVDAIIDDVNV